MRGRAIPRDYQAAGIEWLKAHKRGLLLDRPGLGKTLQAAYAAEAPVLVVCPNYLTGQWEDWLLGRDDKSLAANNGLVIPNVPGTVVRAKGNYYKKLTALQAKADWTIINIEVLQTHWEALEASDMGLLGYWQTIIFDESHHLRNHDATRSKTAVNIAKHAPLVYELTATPIWKEADDLYNQLRILHPDMFKSYWKFVDLFCIADVGRFGTKVLGVKKEMRAELDELLNAVSLRRTYVEAGRELPSLIEKTIKIEFPDNLRKAYDDCIDGYRMQLEDEEIRFDNFSQVLNALRQLTSFPGKIEAVKDLIQNDIPWGRVVVFTWYRDTAEKAARTLGGAVVTGELKVEERRAVALDPNNRIICATISALGEGIDLSDARTVVFLEEHWPPGANDQALSRIQRERIGGDNSEPVVVYYVHVKDTIDEVIHNVAQRRSATIKEVIREALGLG